MIRYENECMDCATSNYPCRGSSCPYINVKRYYCDDCEEEKDLYYFDDEELCIDCIISRLDKVE